MKFPQWVVTLNLIVAMGFLAFFFWLTTTVYPIEARPIFVRYEAFVATALGGLYLVMLLGISLAQEAKGLPGILLGNKGLTTFPAVVTISTAILSIVCVGMGVTALSLPQNATTQLLFVVEVVVVKVASFVYFLAVVGTPLINAGLYLCCRLTGWSKEEASTSF